MNSSPPGAKMMTFYCPKHGLHFANSLRMKPDHRYPKLKLKPEIKTSSCCGPISSEAAFSYGPQLPVSEYLGIEKLLPVDSSERVALVTSQRELRERVKSIEDTLEKFGSRVYDKPTTPTRPTNTPETEELKIKRTQKPIKSIEYNSNKHYLRSRTRPKKFCTDSNFTVARCPSPNSTGSYRRKPRSHNKSGAAMSTLDEDDEEIALLFKELESLAIEEGRMPNISLSSPDYSAKYHSCDNGTLPNKFRCKGCGDVQNIYVPDQFNPPYNYMSYLYSPFPLQSYMDILNPKRTNNSPSGTANPGTPNYSNPNSFEYPKLPNFHYMPYYPYFGLPFAPFGVPRDLSKDPTVSDILKRISASLSGAGEGGKRPRSRSVGTQSIEDLNSERNFEDEDDIVAESMGVGDLQSAPPVGVTAGDDQDDDELHFDSEYFKQDPDSPHDNGEDQDPYFSSLPQSALELRELELSAWAASKWWNLVKTRRALRREYGFADEDEEFCTVEYRNKDNLQSERDDLNLDQLEQQLYKMPNKVDNSASPNQETEKIESDDEPELTEKLSNAVPKGFNSFKQLSVAAKASYKWSQLVEKRRLQKQKKKLKQSKSP